MPTRPELLHPMIVHMPIAIIVIWGILECYIWIFKSKRRSMDATFVLLASLAMIFGFAGNFSGELARDAQELNPEQLAEVAEHASYAIYIGWSYLVLAVLSTVILFTPFNWLRALRYGLAGGIALLIFIAAEHGAELVYEHGIGVLQ